MRKLISTAIVLMISTAPALAHDSIVAMGCDGISPQSDKRDVTFDPAARLIIIDPDTERVTFKASAVVLDPLTVSGIASTADGVTYIARFAPPASISYWQGTTMISDYRCSPL